MIIFIIHELIPCYDKQSAQPKEWCETNTKTNDKMELGHVLALWLEKWLKSVMNEWKLIPNVFL